MSALNLGALGDLPVEVLGLVFDFAGVRTQNEKNNARAPFTAAHVFYCDQ